MLDKQRYNRVCAVDRQTDERNTLQMRNFGLNFPISLTAQALGASCRSMLLRCGDGRGVAGRWSGVEWSGKEAPPLVVRPEIHQG